MPSNGDYAVAFALTTGAGNSLYDRHHYSIYMNALFSRIVIISYCVPHRPYTRFSDSLFFLLFLALPPGLKVVRVAQ